MLCKLCPHNCNVNRDNGKAGFCGESSSVRIARAALHYWEEPCISGKQGSGAVFFTGCPLKCVFCQNEAIANNRVGKVITLGRLCEIFLELQEQGANNINLVTPTHFVPQIVSTLTEAKKQGLTIPIVYNTGSYEHVETLKQLEGLVDIYLPDLKYYSNKLSLRYSHVEDYFDVASNAISEMIRQVGVAKIDTSTGLMEKGVIVRHLLLPKHLADSKKVMEYLFHTYGNQIYISIMSQYTPMKYFPEYPELSRKVSRTEYRTLVDFCINLGIEQAFIQDGSVAEESFIPDFNYEGVDPVH